MARRSSAKLRVGVDVGGTFTDFVVCGTEGQLETFKLLSTADPAEAVLAGLERIRKGSAVGSANDAPELEIVHGSTVATNALLERKGAVTALVTTCGFRDVLAIGRQNRPELYDFAADPAPPLVPEALRFEIEERVDHEGLVLRPLESESVDDLLAAVKAWPLKHGYTQCREGESPTRRAKAQPNTDGAPGTTIQSIAVCLLFSFLRPEHEMEIARRLREAGYFVSASCEILPEFREYERTATTVVNAYVSPVLDRYLAQLERALDTEGRVLQPSAQQTGVQQRGRTASGKTSMRVMQSNGGSISLEQARRAGVHCILSGPAGGLMGAQHVGNLSMNPPASGKAGAGAKLITFDMGGTSTDVSLIDGAPQVTSESVVGSYPIRIPLLDIHTIGAGGGSIASRDAGGALRVGPQSAGAHPGPACYGLGPEELDQPTVTDANLVLGRLAADHFLGGEMPLHVVRAERALQNLGKQFGMDGWQAALGVIQVINAHMARALRVISVERGHDPRDFLLVSFGGAGGLHAADLARSLGTPTVLIPPLAATLSAFGMLAANVIKDYSQTVMLLCGNPVEEDATRVAVRLALEKQSRAGERALVEEGIASEDQRIEAALDMRYRGQSFELTVPFQEDYVTAFHAAHRQAYGYARQGEPVEIVNARVRATGIVRPPQIAAQKMAGPDPGQAFGEFRPVQFEGRILRTAFFHGEALRPGNQIAGPAVILRRDTTVLVGPTDKGRVDAFGNLMLTIGD